MRRYPFLLFALPALIAAKPVEQVTYKDAVLGCDNTRRCEIVQMPPENDEATDTFLIVSVVRDAGADALPTVSLNTDSGLPTASEMTIKIDGKAAAQVAWKDEEAMLGGEEAMEFLRAAAKGDVVTLESGIAVYATARMNGFSAALRAMDAAQRRAGTVTAIVARGHGPASAVPAPPEAPTIHARKPGKAEPRPLTEAEKTKLLKDSESDEDYADNPNKEFEMAMVDDSTLLVLVPTWSGAYNYGTVPMLADEKQANRTFRLATFDSEPGMSPDTVSLTNAGFDPKTGQLSEFNKGRGIGDCGSSANYVWDGTQFRLSDMYYMGECRGVMHYLRSWTATVVPGE